MERTDDGTVRLSPAGFSLASFNGDLMVDISDQIGALGFLFGGRGPHILGRDSVFIAKICDAECAF